MLDIAHNKYYLGWQHELAQLRSTHNTIPESFMAIRYNDEHRKTLREIINRNDVRHEIENVRFALSHNHDVAFNETKLTAIYHEYKWALTDNGKLEPIPADLREYIDYIDADKQPEREIKPNA